MLKLYSHRPEFHDRLAGDGPGHRAIVDLAHRATLEGRLGELGFEVPITRHSFADPVSVVNHALKLLGKPHTLRWPYPQHVRARDLPSRYAQAVEELNWQLHGAIRVTLDDPLVPSLLQQIERRYREGSWEILARLGACTRMQDDPSDHLRVLGAMLDEALVGPGSLVLDLYHRCNTNCIHCWIHSPLVSGSHGPEFTDLQLDFERVKAIVDDALSLGVGNITLLGDGEPLLHPDFPRILRYIRARGPHQPIIVFTNALALNARNVELLVDCTVDRIYCSVPAATAATWALTNPGHPASGFAHVRENLLRLRDHKRTRGPAGSASWPRPQVVMTFVLHRLNYVEVEAMAELAVEVGAEELQFQLIQSVNHLASLALDTDMVRFLRQRLPRVTDLARAGGLSLGPGLAFQLDQLAGERASGPRPRDSGHNTTDWSRSVYARRGCFIGWALTLIKANGDVSVCCGLKVVDNLRDRSFEEIWRSSRYQGYRTAAKNLLANRDLEFVRSIYEIDHHLFNARCDQCNNHAPNNYYLRLIEESGLRPAVPGLPDAPVPD